MADLQQFVFGVPKAELHVHLEGTLTPDLLFRFAKRNGIDIPFASKEDVVQAYSGLTNLKEFLQLYYLGSNVLRTEEDFYELTANYLSVAHTTHNVIHVEPHFDPQAHTCRGVEFATVITGITRALKEAKELYNMSSCLVMAFNREKSVQDALECLEMARPYKHLISAVGLDSDEIDHPPHPFAAVYARAQADGFRLTAHGGHDGPATPYVSELIDSLHVERIDHGVTAAEDPSLIQTLVSSRIPLTVCPISNVKIGPFASIASHPVNLLYRSGVLICINSDDPAYLLSYISDNILAVAMAFDWTVDDVRQVALNSVEACFLPANEKSILSDKIKHYQLPQAVQIQ
eukprot:GILK01008223.1.p1 GENE.GILK01008223.1~~GILK01008223.1.p1  ORF type:complete len:360 (+),score=30.16 GILK01008223.1:44-1081(+)